MKLSASKGISVCMHCGALVVRDLEARHAKTHTDAGYAGQVRMVSVVLTP